jgi:hypothetical protein
MRQVAQFTFLLLITISCAKEKARDASPEGVTVNADGSQTMRSFYPSKKVKSVVTYRDGRRNGLAQSYDEAGNLLLEINYVNDTKNGKSTRYYTGGAVFQTTEYKDDRIHGQQFKFRADGRPISEARYELDFPCLGLKEFLDNNKPRTKFPEIVIKEVNHIERSGEYTLELSMSNNVKKVQYYTGKLTPSGCVSTLNSGVVFDESRHVGLVQYNLAAGEFVKEQLNIVAVVETLNGNSYVTQKKFNVAIRYQ